MSTVTVFEPGGYRYIPAVFQYSSGVAAEPGYVLERARFIAMTGLPPRTARRVLASLLDFGVLHADGPRSPVRLSVPLASLRFLFPRLWPEAEQDAS